MKAVLVKLPEGMHELWKRAAKERKVTLSQLIREAVNRDIEAKRRLQGKDGT
jgi:hypothetical protein